MHSSLQDVPLVLVPGMKGSTLVDAHSKEAAWLNGNLCLGGAFERVSLKAPLTWTDGVQDRDNLIATDIIRTIDIAYLIKVQFYNKFVDMAKSQGRDLHIFVYDWRRSLEETAPQLERFLEDVVAKTGKKAQVVCHSMGGGLGLLVLNSRPELFHSVMFAGTPFFPGSAKWVEEISVGRTVGVNYKTLSADVAFSFASCFAFLPDHGGGLYDINGKELFIDYYNPESWVEHKLSVFHPDHPDTVMHSKRAYARAYAHLQHVLAAGKRIRQKFVCRPDIEYPPVANLAGNRISTCLTIIKDGPKAYCGYDWLSGQCFMGDGLTDVDSTKPPQGIHFTQYTNGYHHRILLNDTHTVSMILHALHSQARSRQARKHEKTHTQDGTHITADVFVVA
eukprot:comp7369_c0_seq1/m.3062 comp7369_c0_seq1/g.3062  ORF comp7369_c0_seq1/g.3062 comp7369_c0_seq1/m.3062 type:complete len:392 (-) comp7369_c0_seq1:136-1311(-)